MDGTRQSSGYLDWLICLKKSLKIHCTKGVIRIRISKKNRQHNGQRKKYKRTNNDLQNIHIKLKDRVTRTPLKAGSELRCSGRVGSSCSTSDNPRVNLVTNLVISDEWGKTGKCLRHVEHIRGHLWHRYSAPVNQVSEWLLFNANSTIFQLYNG